MRTEATGELLTRPLPINPSPPTVHMAQRGHVARLGDSGGGGAECAGAVAKPAPLRGPERQRRVELGMGVHGGPPWPAAPHLSPGHLLRYLGFPSVPCLRPLHRVF